MGNGNAKLSSNEPNYDGEWGAEAGGGGGLSSRRNSADERRVNPSVASARASPRRFFTGRQESPSPSTVPPLSRESTASLGQRIARHAKQQEQQHEEPPPPPHNDHGFTNGGVGGGGYDNRTSFHQQPRPTKVVERFRKDKKMAPHEMEAEDDDWQTQQPNHQREVYRREPQRRKGVTFDDDVTESVEDASAVRLPPLVNNARRTNGSRFPVDQPLLPQGPPAPVARISRSMEDREFRTVTKEDVRDKLMNDRLRTRFAEPLNAKPSSQWALTDDDSVSNYSSSTASLASRPSRIPQRITAAPRRAPILPPLDYKDTRPSNRQPNSSARPNRRQVPSMDVIPAEANFYHLYHHGIPKKIKRTQQRQW